MQGAYAPQYVAGLGYTTCYAQNNVVSTGIGTKSDLAGSNQLVYVRVFLRDLNNRVLATQDSGWRWVGAWSQVFSVDWPVYEGS